MSLTLNKELIFPRTEQKDEITNENIQIQTYGQRLYKDQTLYEYLLEFLVIFSSPKSVEGQDFKNAGKAFKFLISNDIEQYVYYPSPRMGLKRFIFLNRSEIEKRFKVDINALDDHRKLLLDKINIEGASLKPEFILDILQDLLYGFNAIIGKRSWFAQSLLPVAPELIFCEAIGNKSVRININGSDSKEIDGKFDFNYRAFMARGGEVYYLHVLQGIEECPELKDRLEDSFFQLISSFPQLSSIAQFLQNTWRKDKFDNEEEAKLKNIDYVIKKMEWIPDTYRRRSSYSVKELLNLLSSSVNTIEKIGLLSSLIAIQIIRMMCVQAQEKLAENDNIDWIIDVINEPGNQIRKMAVSSYERLEENLFRAVHTADIDSYRKKNDKREDISIYEDASKDTNRLVRKLGKQLGIVVPPKGGDMRFCMNENFIKILVLSIVPPGERMLYTTFLSKCYEHFKIIIGSKEAQKHWNNNVNLDLTIFDINSEKFQTLLKESGFLRDLSDSTSIVENPFQE